jgi:hypothetical protein
VNEKKNHIVSLYGLLYETFPYDYNWGHRHGGATSAPAALPNAGFPCS